jgi:4-amino-4-deoxy-L-arabinose transferase-like glycosyltransferase
MTFMDAEGRLRVHVIILFALFFWGAGYSVRELWEPDEARFAYVAREMQSSGNWLVPHRSGEYYAHKPPLMFWLTNGFSWLAGGRINPVTSRLPTLLGAILALWATSRIAFLLYGGMCSWLAPLLLSTSVLFWRIYGWGQIDGLLCGLQMASLWLLFDSCERDVRTQTCKRVCAYLLMGFAVLAKGPVGFLIPYGSWIAYSLFSGRMRGANQKHLLWGVIFALLPVAIWLGSIVLTKSAPAGYLDELLFKQNIGRATGEMGSGHVKPFWYFFSYFPLDFLPWGILLPISCMALLRHDESCMRLRTRGILAWILFVVLFFSLSATKRNIYILSVYPAAAIVVAAGWAELARRPFLRGIKLSQWFLGGLFCFLGVAVLLAVPIAPVVVKEEIPIGLSLLLPIGVILSVLGFLLCFGLQLLLSWLYIAALGFGMVLWLCSVLVLPALNPVKTPYAIRTVASKYLPPEQDILLYRMHGEIQALNAGARGRVCVDAAELQDAIMEQGKGVLVLGQDRKDEVFSLPVLTQAIHGSYQMGSKDLIWVAFGYEE